MRILPYLWQGRVEEFKTALERWQTKFAEAEEVNTIILSQQWKILKSNSKVMKSMEGERDTMKGWVGSGAAFEKTLKQIFSMKM